jgi:predicted acyl esterase
VEFRASDGVRLSGWYRAPRNGATILLAHGGGSDRQGSVRHARMLVRHGYGVLLYDARGKGESDGNQSSYGWGWTHDVAGALEFLERRPETGSIGALGISSGADALVEAAPDHPEIAALVTDGLAAGSFEDWHRVRGTEIGTVPGWVMFKTIEVLSGSAPGAALEDRVARIRTPLLMVSAPEEQEFVRVYARASGDRAEHWRTGAGHTAGLREHPEEYERRVVGFLDRALGQAR